MILFRKIAFFSLMEILIVLSLILLVGSVSTFYMHDALRLRRFEANRKSLQYMICFCREMAMTHQVDIQWVIEQDLRVPNLVCRIFCEEDQKALLYFANKKSSFAPLFFAGPNSSPSYACTFYSSGFVEANMQISDGKRTCALSFPFFIKPIDGSKPPHPFSFKKKREVFFVPNRGS